MTMFITMNDEAITLVTFVVSLGTVKGAATKLCLGGGDRFMAPKPTYPSKSIFSSDFDLYFENV